MSRLELGYLLLTLLIAAVAGGFWYLYRNSPGRRWKRDQRKRRRARKDAARTAPE